MHGAGPWARQLVATLLRQGPLGGEWTVYPHPVEQLSSPAAFVAPRTPYRERATHRVERVNLAVVLAVTRAQDADSIDALDLKLDDVREALELDARIEVPAIAELGPPVNVGGVEFLTGRLDIIVNTDC
jgi:hypothetical protein